jgi:hypothetical protein
MKRNFIIVYLFLTSCSLFAQWGLNGNAIGPTNWLGSLNNQPLLVRTNSIERFKVMSGGTGVLDGRVAMGNNLTAGFIPQARLHLHQTTDTSHIKFTNTLTGSGVNNGFNVGVAGNGVAQFRQYYNSSFQFLFARQGIFTATLTLLPPNAAGDLDIVRVCPDNVPGRLGAKLTVNDRNPDILAVQPGQQPDNLLTFRATGWGRDFNVPVAAGQSSPDNVNVIGFFQSGRRGGADAGIRIEGSRFSSPRCDIGFIDFANYDPNQISAYAMARIAAGNRQGTNQNGFLRFYTRNNSNPLEERMRIDEFGRVGINTFNNTPAVPGNHGIPRNRLEITSDLATDPTPSGLRLTNLTSAAVPVVNPGLGVLAVDANGDVIYVQDNPPSTSLGNLCGAAPNPLTGDYEVPLNGFNFYFSNQGTPNDKVGIGYNCFTPMLGKLSVLESVGNIAGDFLANSGGSNIGINLVANTGINNTGAQAIVNGGGLTYGYYADVFNGTVITSGVDATATSTSPLVFGGAFRGSNGTFTYGVYGEAQGGGTNYSVFGEAFGPGGSPVSWAGYFNGDVMTTAATYYTSATALKQNIQPLQNALSTLGKIKASSYNFNGAAFPSMSLPNGLEYGVIAENIDTILPDLVKNITHPAKYDSTGAIVHPAVNFKGVNYTELIPWLIAGINELNEVVQSQQNTTDSLKRLITSQDSINRSLEKRMIQIEECLTLSAICNTRGNSNRETTSVVTLQNATAIVLDQNNPNPFKETTFITYNIPNDVKSATMVFYDMNGRMIKEVNITERGESQLQVYGSDLSTGIYTYTLVVDGKVHASKKMVKN